LEDKEKQFYISFVLVDRLGATAQLRSSFAAAVGRRRHEIVKKKTSTVVSL